MWVAFWLFVSVLLGVLSLPDSFLREVREGALVLAAAAFLVFVWAAAGALIIRIKLRPQVHALLERPRIIRVALVGLALILMASAAPTVHRWYEPRATPIASPTAPQAADPTVLDAIGRLEKRLDEKLADSGPRAHASSTYSRVFFQSVPFLYDRDPESWRGHRYGEPPLKLDESTRLEMPVGEWQRFNPQLVAAEALFNVNIFIVVPRALEVREPKLWRISSSDNETAQYWAQIGEASPGIIQGLNEALYLKAKTPSRFNVAYVISGRGEQSGGLQPTRRVLTIEAK